MSFFNFLRRSKPLEDQIVYGPRAQARREALQRRGLDPDRILPFSSHWDDEELDEDGNPVGRLYAAQVAYTGGDSPDPEVSDLTLLVFLVPDGIKYIEDCPAEAALRIARKGEYSKAVAWLATEWSALHSQTGFGSVDEAKESLTDYYAHAGMSSSVSDPTGSLRAWAKRHDGSGFPDLDLWSTTGFQKKSHKFFSESSRRKAGKQGALGQAELDELRRELEEALSSAQDFLNFAARRAGTQGPAPKAEPAPAQAPKAEPAPAGNTPAK